MASSCHVQKCPCFSPPASSSLGCPPQCQSLPCQAHHLVSLPFLSLGRQPLQRRPAQSGLSHVPRISQGGRDRDEQSGHRGCRLRLGGRVWTFPCPGRSGPFVQNLLVATMAVSPRSCLCPGGNHHEITSWWGKRRPLQELSVPWLEMGMCCYSG